jgi:hypothetical protein
LFCPIGQNELDINECDAQIPHILKNLRSPNEVRGNNRLTVVIENTLIITVLYHKIEDFKRYFHKKLI